MVIGIILVLVLILVFSLVIFVRELLLSKKNRERFVSFLENINDFSTLYEIGEYNKLRLKERRRVLNTLSILTMKYNETGIKEYKDYHNAAIKSTKIILLSFFTVFFSFCIIQIFLAQ